MSNEIVRTQMPLNELMSISKAFAESGMFADTRQAAQAIVKVQAGQEMGISPFAAMSGIHIIQGKPTVGAGIIASCIKRSGKYNYKVKELTETNCAIDFYEGEENIGTSIFSIADAKKAGTKNLDKFPKNMLFARAISNGVKFYCPDVFNGPVYVPEEMEQPLQSTEDIKHEEVASEKKIAADKLKAGIAAAEQTLRNAANFADLASAFTALSPELKNATVKLKDELKAKLKPEPAA